MVKRRKWQLLILNALNCAGRPMSSAAIAADLVLSGVDVSERSVRLYLKEMDEVGWTESRGKKGRLITADGVRELEGSEILKRIGFLSAKIDCMIYRMNFDLHSRSGTVVVNLSLMDPEELLKRADLIGKVFSDGLAMGRLVALYAPGERCANMEIPDGRVGVATVCSITLNGVLLKYGIPMHSKFGGLLELRDRKAVRFAEVIMYEGTTIDPLEVFIRSGMTDYVGAVTTGSGRIGASFREIPVDSRDRVLELADQLDYAKLGGFMTIGAGGQSVLDVPVNHGRAGAIVIGGLNPVAILEEQGVRVDSRALAGLVDYSRLFPHEELADRTRIIMKNM